MVKKKKAKKKKVTKKGGKKKAFGGYTVNFKDCLHTLENIFGTKPIPPSQMTKKLWAYVKRNRLNTK
ncbi:MAG: hypothetical protein V2A66_04705 [Pseudomonadota bacterium]